MCLNILSWLFFISYALWYSCLEHQHQCHHQRWCSGKHMPTTYIHLPCRLYNNTCPRPMIEFHHVTLCLCLCISHTWSWTSCWGTNGRRPVAGWGMRKRSIQPLRNGGPHTFPVLPSEAFFSSAGSWAQVRFEDISREICVVKMMAH